MRQRINRLTMTLCALVIGCGDDTNDDADSDAVSELDVQSPDSDAPDSTGATTYHGTVRAIIEENCVSCHTDGGAAPFALDTFEQAHTARFSLVAAVASGQMPPWPMDPDCRDVKDARVLSESDLAAVAAWAEDGFAEGDPADYTAPPASVDVLASLGPADLELVPSDGYVPDRARPDDYRCFLYPQTVDSDLYIRAHDVVPDQRPYVHHVLLYMIPAADVAAVETRIAADAQPGYTCYGGVGTPGDTLIGGWVPGMVPTVYPEGAAFFVPAGSRFVAQIHYNTLGIPADTEIPADASGARLWQMTERPTHNVAIAGLAKGNLQIPANERDVVAVQEVPSPVSGTIIGTIPHMHLLGTAIDVDVTHYSGETSCVTRVPSWDFNWQQVYMFDDADHVDVRLGETLRISCTYDNTAENQPTVNGEPQTPRDVTWGEGTLDEMCLNYVLTMTPNIASGDGTLCDGFDVCIDTCDDDDALCVLDCLSYPGVGCVQCGIGPVYTDCGVRECPLQMAGLGGCIQDCGGDVLECAVTECQPQLSVVNACLLPKLRAGACNADTAACEINVAP